jgi:very-short-patch-repair endonuclease
MPPADERKHDSRGAGTEARRASAHSERLPVEIVPVEDVRRVSAAAAKRDPDRLASRVARRQLNLISVEQLHAAGFGDAMITRRRNRATLHRVHRGVYLFGTDVLLPGAPELAAVLACGPDAWVRRRSALSLLELIPPRQGDIEIAVLRNRASRSGIAVRRLTALPDIDRETANGIPITAPPFALLEFAAVANGDELERAIAEAYALKLVSEPQLRAALDRHAGRVGVVALRVELDRIGGPQWTDREGERRMKLLLRQAGLPIPVTRMKVAGFKADFFWREYRLIVEFDGYQYHGHRYAFERDRRRDQAHIAAGYTVIRFTWRQLEAEPLRVIAVIANAIGAARRVA